MKKQLIFTCIVLSIIFASCSEYQKLLKSTDSELKYNKAMEFYQAEDYTRAAPFPEELPYRLIQLYSFKGDIILDPFMGSGTTAVAAIKSERKFVGYDISQEYIDLSEKRLKPLLEQTTLKFATVENDEE